MGAIVINFIKIALQVLAGVGIGKLADKVAPDKVPTYPASGVHEPGFDVPKIAWLVVTMALGAILLKLVGKRLKINILK
jgi:hypothetical protein